MSLLMCANFCGKPPRIRAAYFPYTSFGLFEESASFKLQANKNRTVTPYYNDICRGLSFRNWRFISSAKPWFSPGNDTAHTANGSESTTVKGVIKKSETDVEDIAESFKPGKFRGTGLPRPVGQPDDLPSIEFGKPTGMYNFVRHQHGDPRGHLQEDGRFREHYATDNFHWYDAYTDVPKQRHTIVNGESMILGVETRPMEELFGVKQTNIPFYPRRRLNLWGGHKTILRAEFCFFWIPTFIIFSLAIPCYTMLYMMDEAVYTTMTVKVIGHQWYWVYEVESPPEES